MKENTNTRLSKKFFVVGKVYDTAIKFFVVGKVYDTAIMTDQEIKDTVQKDLDDYIGTGKVNFNIHTEPNMIFLIFRRSTNYYEQNNVDLAKDMVDADAFMVTGEGYNDFHLPSMFSIAPFGYSPYVMSQSDFKMAYKDGGTAWG